MIKLILFTTAENRNNTFTRLTSSYSDMSSLGIRKHPRLVTPDDLPYLCFFKLTNQRELHNDFQYTTGLNTDHLSFDPTGECSPGGLYFFDQTQLKYFFQYTNGIKYIRKVTFPKDAQIYCEEHKYKCHQLILGERKEFYLDEYLPREEVLAVVQQYPEALKYVKVQTEEMCLAAVQKHAWALKYVLNQTPEICLAAVHKNGWDLEYVKEQTPGICLVAVQQYGLALEYVKEQTPEICLAAVKQYPKALEYVKAQTRRKICLAAMVRC